MTTQRWILLGSALEEIPINLFPAGVQPCFLNAYVKKLLFLHNTCDYDKR